MNSKYDFRIIRILRRRLSLTLQALAGRAGLTYPTVESIETNKTLPSLKTLDALAGALQISTSDLLGLAERRLVQRRKAHIEPRSHSTRADKGLEKCRVARYDKGKLIRVAAQTGDHVHVMGLHEDVHEFCYVLSGCVELRDRGQDLPAPAGRHDPLRRPPGPLLHPDRSGGVRDHPHSEGRPHHREAPRSQAGGRRGAMMPARPGSTRSA